MASLNETEEKVVFDNKTFDTCHSPSYLSKDQPADIQKVHLQSNKKSKLTSPKLETIGTYIKKNDYERVFRNSSEKNFLAVRKISDENKQRTSYKSLDKNYAFDCSIEITNKAQDEKITIKPRKIVEDYPEKESLQATINNLPQKNLKVIDGYCKSVEKS